MSGNFFPGLNRALETPTEDLDVEFKCSLRLGDHADQAILAKAICALANHGGGSIVLGRNDDGSYPAALPEEIADVNQDEINNIAEKYLQPAPHCSVISQSPKGIGFAVPVIEVPSCGTSPVCAKKNGPDDTKGRTQGIVKGTHYIRKAGPASAPINSPDEWQTVIRRCVLNDRKSLLGALATMIEQPRPGLETDEPNILDVDFAHSINMWKGAAKEHSCEVDLTNSFVGYGFQLLDVEQTNTNKLSECLRIRPYIGRGGVFFFECGPSAPYQTIVKEVAGRDGLEVHANTSDIDVRQVWRLSECLVGTEVISYLEDSDWLKNAVESRFSSTWESGQHIWIKQQIANTDSFLGTVKHIADYFNFIGEVRICAFFSGLNGRSLRSPDPSVHYSLDYRAHQNTRKVDVLLSVSDLADETRSATIAKLFQTVNKLTQGPEVTADSVVRSLSSTSYWQV